MGDLIKPEIPPEVYKVETYTGTMESLENLVKNLYWNFGDYHFNAITKELINAKLGIYFQIGDCYTYRLPEYFEAIG